MKSETLLLLLAILFTGLMAGIFFTWSNAVKPGIGQLSDLEYLGAFQSMNRVILNPSFKLIFFGALICIILVPVFHFKSQSSQVLGLMILAGSIYVIGAFFITIFGNIPVNELLDSANLEALSINEASLLREAIESKWNFYNWVRTGSSTLSFMVLLIASSMVSNAS